MSDTSERVRTTFRLPRHLHKKLLQVSAACNETVQFLIETALSRELDRRMSPDLPTPDNWSPLLAQRFFECIPTPVVVKDTQARILWCNLAYEILLGLTQQELRGRTVQSLGALDEYSSQRLFADLQKLTSGKRRGIPMEFWEPITINGSNRVFRALRFGFEVKLGKKTTELFGDISFDWTAMHIGRLQQVNESLYSHIASNSVQQDIEDVFTEFLQKCPSAIAIKRTSGEIVWCNTTYLRLVSSSTRLEDVDDPGCFWA